MRNIILYSEVNILCILILLLLSIKVKKSMFLQTQRQLFFLVTITNCIFFVLDLIWVFVDTDIFNATIPFNWALNAAYFVFSALVSVVWFAYSESLQASTLTRNKYYMDLCYLPAVLLVILTFISLKTGWLFYIDAQNVYHRGPLYFLQIILAYGYVIFTASKALYHSFHTDSYQKQMEYRTIASFVVPTLITGTIQTLLGGIPVLCIGNTLGILYIYLNLQEQLISIDPLTKLNNRNQLFSYLSTKMRHNNENKNLYLLMMDANRFKSINDTYGHVEGDHALQLIADALRRSCNKHNYFLSRYGGDEFIILCELEPTEDVEDVCNAVHKELSKADTPYDLSLSIGYEKYSPDIKSQQDFISRADKKLYKIKQARR